MVPLLIGIGVLGLVIVARARRVRNGIVYAGLGVVAWVAFLKSGVDSGHRGGGDRACWPSPTRRRARISSGRPTCSGCFASSPPPSYARSARAGVRTAISPNERLQQLYHPLSSYVIVPLFALANAGIAINGGFLAHAYASPITLGIIVGYVVGKPIGIAGRPRW